MSGLELLLIPVLAPVVAGPIAGAYAYVRGQNQPEDDAESERARIAAAKVAGEEAERTAALLEALRAADSAHQAAISLWGRPFSLFTAKAQEDAVSKGVPSWAIDCIRQSMLLADESGELSDLADVYEAQIGAAGREEGRDVVWQPVFDLTKRLNYLVRKIVTHQPRLAAARAAFDAPADAPEAAPFEGDDVAPALPPLRLGSQAFALSAEAPQLRRCFTPGGGRVRFQEVLGMKLEEDGALVGARKNECWATVNYKMSGAGEFKWSFEVVDENIGWMDTAALGAFYGLCCSNVDDDWTSADPSHQWVYIQGRTGNCYKSKSKTGMAWSKTSPVKTGDLVHFHLDLSKGVLLGSVNNETPTELVRDTGRFAGKVWTPGVGSQGAKPIVRLVTCSEYSKPVVIIQPVAADNIVMRETAKYWTGMQKGLDRQRREKPMMKMWRSYIEGAQQGLVNFVEDAQDRAGLADVEGDGELSSFAAAYTADYNALSSPSCPTRSGSDVVAAQVPS